MSDEVTVRKISTTVPVSGELLVSPEMANHWRVLLGLAPDERTPEEIAEQRAEIERERAEIRAKIAAMHASHLATASDLGRAVLELHEPVMDEHDWRATCRGCEADGYECEWPEWPCGTYELVSGWPA